VLELSHGITHLMHRLWWIRLLRVRSRGMGDLGVARGLITGGAAAAAL